MPKTELRSGDTNQLCGVSFWHPKGMQRFATPGMFLLIYGFLGTIQAMSYMYFVISLTTIERRFKLTSQTTGIVLSGNEISQIMLSLILSYFGGQRNRPLWIAWGNIFCGISCFILALPHFIYGPGEEALQLTQEYYSATHGNYNDTIYSISSMSIASEKSKLLCGFIKPEETCETYFSLLPLILIFLSQFVLGIGNTLYYALGQTYLDDSSPSKKNVPIILAVASSLRMVGPIIGFPLGYFTLNMYIDPTKTPMITPKDPRWLGAWWLGWIVLGTLLISFSGLIGLFPKELPKKIKSDPESKNSHLPHALKISEFELNEVLPMGSTFSSNMTINKMTTGGATQLPTLADFPRALMRLLRNKLLMYNNIAAVFYILAGGGYMTFMSKYMETQFHKTSQDSTIIAGPVSIFGMILGMLGSSLILTKFKPGPSKVLMWNVILGVLSILGQTSYSFIYCPSSVPIGPQGKMDFNTTCNMHCLCPDQFTPVCHYPSKTLFFSACHAGCTNWDTELKVFTNCSCLRHDDVSYPTTSFDSTTFATSVFDESTVPARKERSFDAINDVITPGVCEESCSQAFLIFTISSMINSFLSSSGKIGNLLVNYRSVSEEDKSFAQGLLLMMVSLFALIPGPIIFGRLIDSTCLVWTESCNDRGNCQLYDQTSLRHVMNFTAVAFTVVAVCFDVLVWKHGRNLDLYGDKEAKFLEARRRNKAVTPLLNKK